MVATLATGGGAGPWGPGPARAGGGREGRLAVLVWFPVRGRAGAPRGRFARAARPAGSVSLVWLAGVS